MIIPHLLYWKEQFKEKNMADWGASHAKDMAEYRKQLDREREEVGLSFGCVGRVIALDPKTFYV
jgi:hypothetical protein